MTGTDYRFSGLERVQLVDPRDAVALVRNPLFRVEGIVEMMDRVTAAPGGGAGHA